MGADTSCVTWPDAKAIASEEMVVVVGVAGDGALALGEPAAGAAPAGVPGPCVTSLALELGPSLLPPQAIVTRGTRREIRSDRFMAPTNPGGRILLLRAGQQGVCHTAEGLFSPQKAARVRRRALLAPINRGSAILRRPALDGRDVTAQRATPRSLRSLVESQLHREVLASLMVDVRSRPSRRP
jgi:hypothetical protein